MKITIDLPKPAESLIGTVEVLEAVARAMEDPSFDYEAAELMDGSFAVQTIYGTAFVTPDDSEG